MYSGFQCSNLQPDVKERKVTGFAFHRTQMNQELCHTLSQQSAGLFIFLQQCFKLFLFREWSLMIEFF
jgi:hypothetical protein